MTREEATRRNAMQNELKPFCCSGKWKEGAEMTKEYIEREAAIEAAKHAWAKMDKEAE